MKWFIALLLVLNLGLFLWATGHDPRTTASVAEYPAVNPEGMKLLSEMRSQQQEKTANEDEASPSSVFCVRIGPFVNSAMVSAASSKLNDLSLVHEQRTVKSRSIRAYRVFLGPFNTQTAVSAQRQLLNASGIIDHYIKREPEGGDLVSLGLFSQRDGANLFMEKLENQGVAAKLRAEDRFLEPNFWLEINDSQIAANIPSDLAASDWGEERAKWRQFSCP